MYLRSASLLALAQRFLQRHEQTTTANVGPYPVPLGPVLRRQFPEEPIDDEEELEARLRRETQRIQRRRTSKSK